MSKCGGWCLAAFVAALIGLPSNARGQGVEATRSLTFALGTGLSLAGNVIEEGVGRINGQPAVLVEQAFSNHFSDGLRVRVMGSYGIDYDKEAFLTFAYGRLNATERITGSVAGYPLYTRFSTARTVDLEGGLRYYFLPEGPTRTYVAGVAGLRFLQETDATLRVLELGLTLDGLEYFDSSTLFIFGADAGVSRDVADNVAVGAEIGLRYQPKPGAASILSGTGLEDVNDTGSRWSLPLSAFITYRF